MMLIQTKNSVVLHVTLADDHHGNGMVKVPHGHRTTPSGTGSNLFYTPWREMEILDLARLDSTAMTISPKHYRFIRISLTYRTASVERSACSSSSWKFQGTFSSALFMKS